MAQITAASVKSLRDRTGLPMMDCKEALNATEGDPEAAVEWLRKRGLQIQGGKTGRATEFGTFGLYGAVTEGVGAMVEIQCESAPVAGNKEFRQLAADLAKQLATGPGAGTPDELLDQPSPSKPGTTLREQKDDLFNRIREVFNVARLVRFDAPSAGYVHSGATVVGVLVEVEGDANAAAARDVAMHVAAMRPQVTNTEELSPEVIEKERTILREAALKEGKPESIIDKMVEGRLRNFYAESVLNEQPFVKAEDGKTTVAQYAKQNGFKVKRFVRWELGK